MGPWLGQKRSATATKEEMKSVYEKSMNKFRMASNLDSVL
jgi:hypothetical protein